MTDTTTNAPAPTTDADTKRQVAKHELIAVPGGEHVNIAVAKGIRYTDLASGEKFEFFPDEKSIMMLALFGAKTKATNETSRARQTGGDSQAQMEALDEVFGLISTGVWREKAEGGLGSRTDRALLAAVLVAMLGDKAQGTVDTYQNRLETEDAYFKKVWSNDDIKAEYKKRKGQTGPALDTLA